MYCLFHVQVELEREQVRHSAELNALATEKHGVDDELAAIRSHWAEMEGQLNDAVAHKLR